MPSFTIERTDDKELVRRLHEELFPGDRFYADSLADWLVINKKGKVVGFCMLGEWSPGIGFLARAGLTKRARGHGLHRRLITVRERLARKLGYSQMMTYTAIESVASSLNLEKACYKLCVPPENAPEGNWLCWQKQLVKPLPTQETSDGTAQTLTPST